MAVSHTATGARSAGGTTTVSPAYPAGVAAGRLAIASRVVRPSTATGTPETGWNQTSSYVGGTGTFGPDSGLSRVVVDTRVLDGSESGSVTFDNANSPTDSHGVLQIYQHDLGAGATWDIVESGDSDAGHATGGAGGSGSHDFQVGDVLVVVRASDTDDPGTFTSPTATLAGVTFSAGTVRLDAGGIVGTNRSGLYVFEFTVTAGSGTGAVSFSFDGGPANCGPMAFLRLRAAAEVWPPAGGHGIVPITVAAPRLA